MEVSTPGRSATEPSTPVRGLSPQLSGSHTDPNRRSHGVRIPLPPHDIPRLSFTLAQEEARRAERRSRRSGRHLLNSNEPASRSRSRSRRDSITLDPRLSGDFAQRVKRRRRSSLIEVDRHPKRILNPGYVEPVTVDYLKFFCQVLIAEKNKLAERQLPAVESPPPRPRSRSRSSNLSIRYSDQNPEIDEFNNSLPLPSDTHPLLSPIIRPDPDVVFEHDTPNEIQDSNPVPSSKPKSFSYLERILASQGQKKQEAPAYTFGPQSFKTPASKAPKSPVDQASPFIINDKGGEMSRELPLPDIPVEQETTPQPINVPVTTTPPHLSDGQSEPGSNKIVDETGTEGPELTEGIEEANFEIPNDLDIQLEQETLTEPPQEPSFGDTLAQNMLSPPTALPVHTPSFGGTPERTFQDVLGFSPSIIQEEYTLMDAVDVPDIIEPDSDGENPQRPPLRDLPSPLPAEDLSEQTTTTTRNRTRIPHALLSLPDQEVSTVSSFPVAMIRKMVKASQVSAFENQVNLVPAVRKKVRFRPEIYQEIAAKSSEFILAMMEDLEAYASHRSASPNYQITIKDVLLYLHRIRFIKNNSDEIDTVARLAHSVLPTETLISLDNSIAGAVEMSSGLKSSAESDDLYMDDYYGSESLDDNIADL